MGGRAGWRNRRGPTGDARSTRLSDAARADDWWDALREAPDVEYPAGDFPLRPPLAPANIAQRNERYAVRTRFAAWVAQVLDDVVAQVVAHAGGFPDGAAEEVLQGVGGGVAASLGEL